MGQEPTIVSKTQQNDGAGWALGRGYIALESVSEAPWATVSRAYTPNRQTAILKVVAAPRGKMGGGLPNWLSDHFAGLCPMVLGEDRVRGITLYEDLAKDASESQTLDRQQLLATYGQLQSVAAQVESLQHVLPATDAHEVLSRVLELAQGRGALCPGNPFDLLDRKTRDGYRALLEGHEGRLRKMADALNTAAPTLNHTDLRSANAHLRADGSICIIDWDDAIVSAPGWSLHNVFGGVTRLVHTLSVPSAFKSVGAYQAQRTLLEAYIEPLIATKFWSRKELTELLPQAAVFGVFKYITDMAPYDISDPSTSSAVQGMVERRMADLKSYLDADNPMRSAAIVRPKSPEVDFATGSMAETAKRGAEMFRAQGALFIRNCVSPNTLRAVTADLVASRAQHKADIYNGRALKVGHRRYMVSLSTDGAVGSPEVLAAAPVMAVIDNLLGNDAVLGSLTTVLALGGSERQHLHRDNSYLFPEDKALDTPPFCIAAIIPLVPITEELGTTEIHLGSHKPQSEGNHPRFKPLPNLGDCYLMDSRVLHRGLPNRTKTARPILSLVYQRPWYHDYQNFNVQSGLKISNETVAQFPKDRRHLVNWAVSE